MNNNDDFNAFILFLLLIFLTLLSIQIYLFLKDFLNKSFKKLEKVINKFETNSYKSKIEEINNQIISIQKEIESYNINLDRSESYNFILNRFVSVDVETTGLKAANSNIIQISFVLFLNGEPRHMYCKYINPGVPLPESATKVNNITNDMVKDAPHFSELAEFISRIITREKIIAHNLRFDATFIERELSKTQYANQVNWGFCTMSLDLARPVDLSNKPNRFIKLTALAKEYNIEIKGRLHDAYTDALLAGKIAVKIAKQNTRDTQFFIIQKKSKEDEIKNLLKQRQDFEQKITPLDSK